MLCCVPVDMPCRLLPLFTVFPVPTCMCPMGSRIDSHRNVASQGLVAVPLR